MEILSNAIFNGVRLRQLTKAINPDEPLRRAEYVAGALNVYHVGASWVNTAGIVVPAINVVVPIHVQGKITKSTILTKGGSGSCQIDIWKRSYGTYPPLVGDSITASALPAVVTGIKYQDVTLTGWITTVAVDDVLEFKLVSSSTFTQISLFLDITPT